MSRLLIFVVCFASACGLVAALTFGGCHAPQKLFDRTAGKSETQRQQLLTRETQAHPLYLLGPWPADRECGGQPSACEWRFADNMTGPGGTAVWAGQVGADVDGDGDSDLMDVARMQPCGPNYWAGPCWRLIYSKEPKL